MEQKFNLNIYFNENGGAIKTKNGSYITFEVDPVKGDSLNIDQIDFDNTEDAKEAMDALKDIAEYFYELPIDIYALPTIGESITEEELKQFLEDQGFSLHPNDVDYTLYRWP